MSKKEHLCPPNFLPMRHPETDELLVVVETPKGSRHKYNYDETLCCFAYGTTMPEGVSFPFDFGFVPRTLAADGDPLDVLLLTDAPMEMGCAVPVRLIGVIEAKQTEKGGKTERNDRLLAVPTKCVLYANVKSIKDLSKALLSQVEEFFGYYNRLKGKVFKPTRCSGPKAAERLLKQAEKQYRKRSH